MKFQSQSGQHMPGEGFTSSDAGFSITMSILPISIRHTSTHVAFCPEWIPGDGDESSEVLLTDKPCHSSVYITSHTMLGRKRPETIIDGEPSKRFTLYFIVIEAVICTGQPGPTGGIGVRKLRLSQLTPMPNFWKLGFSITMEVIHSDGFTMSLINV